MKINCPKCGAGLEQIYMKSRITCGVTYDDETDEFDCDRADSCEVEEVECECDKCGHEWDWDAYKRNCNPTAEESRIKGLLAREMILPCK